MRGRRKSRIRNSPPLQVVEVKNFDDAMRQCLAFFDRREVHIEPELDGVNRCTNLLTLLIIDTPSPPGEWRKINVNDRC